MNTNIDFLIELMDKYTTSKVDAEMEEQATTSAAPQASSSAQGYPPVTKWEDRPNATKRGKANPLMKKSEKWSTGLTRSVANTLL
jgi:hypothetical protein